MKVKVLLATGYTFQGRHYAAGETFEHAAGSNLDRALLLKVVAPVEAAPAPAAAVETAQS